MKYPETNDYKSCKMTKYELNETKTKLSNFKTLSCMFWKSDKTFPKPLTDVSEMFQHGPFI